MLTYHTDIEVAGRRVGLCKPANVGGAAGRPRFRGIAQTQIAPARGILPHFGCPAVSAVHGRLCRTDDKLKEAAIAAVSVLVNAKYPNTCGHQFQDGMLYSYEIGRGYRMVHRFHITSHCGTLLFATQRRCGWRQTAAESAGPRGPSRRVAAGLHGGQPERVIRRIGGDGWPEAMS